MLHISYLLCAFSCICVGMYVYFCEIRSVLMANLVQNTFIIRKGHGQVKPASE